jgi:integrase
MKTDLTYVMEAISHVDGRITIADLSPAEIEGLRHRVVWAYSAQRAPNASYSFGDKSFRPQGIRRGVTINTGSTQYDYEVKAVMLLLFHSGLQEGGVPYKWQSVSQRARTLVRFAGYCTRHGLQSFRNISVIPALKFRNLLLGFITDSGSKGGMDARNATSSYKTVRDSLRHLADYGLVKRPDFGVLMDEFTLANIEKHETENRLRHAIIPTGVMKRLIAEATTYIEQAEAKFDEFATLFRKSHQAIVATKCKDPKDAVFSTEREAFKKLKVLLYGHFRDLQRHTYTLVLAFTGMRDGEAGALKTGCAGHRTENGEQLYYVRSLLSKTDDNAISLDWVANDSAYRAVTILSKVNALYYERARLFQKHYDDALTEEEHSELAHGLAEQWLFGLRLTIGTANFMRLTKGSDGVRSLDLGLYHIPVTEADLAQLEQMECNYRSVAANSGHRGKPYVVSDIFNLTAHQFRHTFAWFIIANRLGDLDDIKYQFKHLHQAMTLVYTERGFKSLNELRIVIEHFEMFINGRSIDDIVQSAAASRVAGGGGERLARMLQALNTGTEGTVYGAEHQSHFHNVTEVIAFTTRHSNSIRGLPHGYCTKGPSCKIKNAADPSHCLYCDTYFATPKHLPYWRTIKANCEAKLSRIVTMPEDAQQQFQAFRQALEDNLFAADKIIGQLVPTAHYQPEKNVNG